MSSRHWPLCLALMLCIGFSGCTKLNLFRMQSPDKEKELDTLTDRSEDIEFVGSYATVGGNTVIAVHGVGLVVGLDNTGEDPPPSIYRTRLREDLTKAGIKEPNKLLGDPSTALVMLTAYLPADIRKGDPFDVEVRLPPNTTATNLAGGRLVRAYLTESAIVPGAGELKGKTYGVAQGPILVSIGKGETASGAQLRGRILGGGIAFKERNLGLYLRSDYASVRNSKRISDRIGARFHSYEHGSKLSLAKAINNLHVELKVHPRYKDNYPRYIQVVRHVAFRETPVQQRDRMERLQEELNDPATAAKAAIQYEAIGNESLPFLKKGLNSTSAEVRFYSAEALAYLGDEAGAEELGKLAKEEPAFRVYCFAALAALDEAVCFPILKTLLSETSAETRYGAFRALWTLDRDDPLIRGAFLGDQFWLHTLDSTGDPMVHMTRHRRPEIVLFGRDQKFRTPVALTAGLHININGKAGMETLTISRFQVGREDQRKVVSTRVEDVIMAVAEMGATYPDIAQMLSQANTQYNLPGRMEIDAMPQSGRLYYRSVGQKDGTEKKQQSRVGRSGMTPNLFPNTTPIGEEPTEDEEIETPIGTPNKADAADSEGTDAGAASLEDIREGEAEALPPAKSQSWWSWPFSKSEGKASSDTDEDSDVERQAAEPKGTNGYQIE